MHLRPSEKAADLVQGNVLMQFHLIGHAEGTRLLSNVACGLVAGIADQRHAEPVASPAKLLKRAEQSPVALQRRPGRHDDHVDVALNVGHRFDTPMVDPPVGRCRSNRQIRAEAIDKGHIARLDRFDQNRKVKLRVRHHVRRADAAPAGLQHDLVSTRDSVDVEQRGEKWEYIRVVQ